MKEILKIEKLTELDFHKYEEYIKSKEKSLLFHSIKYQQLVLTSIKAELETIIVTNEIGEIKGTLPLASKKGLFGKVYNSFPFYGSNGGFIYDNEDVFLLLNSFFKNLINLSDTCLTMISENPLNLNHKVKGDIIEKRTCQFTKLNYTEVESGLMNSFHYKTRNMIRKSQKQNIEIYEDNLDIEFLYNTHYENMKAIEGTAKPELFFKDISKFFIPGVDYKIFIAKKDKIKISALLLFYFNGTVEYYTPVIKTEYRNLQSNSLLIFHAMMESASIGYKWWNWGGTWKTQVELYRFKSKWGAIDVEYNYYINLKKKDFLNNHRDVILSEYPFFFTVPFNLLNSNG